MTGKKYRWEMKKLNIEDFDIDLSDDTEDTKIEKAKSASSHPEKLDVDEEEFDESEEDFGFDEDGFDKDDFDENDEEKGGFGKGRFAGAAENAFETAENKVEEFFEWCSSKFEQLMELMKEPTNELELYKYRVRKEKIIKGLQIAGVAIGVFLFVFLVKYAVEHHTYDSYSVLEVSEKENTGVTHFVEFKGNVLHYSADGATLTAESEKTIWTDSYQMSQPVAEIHDSVIVIYDLKGTLVTVYNKDGKMGSFQTEYPIMKADVSGEGEVAVILENGETTHLNYYTATGSLIASGTSNMRNPGYPVDLAVSKDGISVVVTYFVADEDTISSYIAFYNFGDAGKNKEDNLVNGVRCAGILVPKVEYLNNDRVIAYSEEGFKIYKVKNEAEEIKEVIFEQDIVSACSDGTHIGFVFRNEEGKEPFLVKLFDSSGNEKMETKINIIYDEIKISGNRIVMNNATQMAVYSLKGIEKFFGNIEEGSIQEVVKVGSNEYQVVYGNGVATIKLK